MTGSFETPGRERHEATVTLENEPETIWIAESWASNTGRDWGFRSLNDLEATVHVLITAAVVYAMGPIRAHLAHAQGMISVVFDAVAMDAEEASRELAGWLAAREQILKTHASRWGSAPDLDRHDVTIWAEVAERDPSRSVVQA